MIHLLGSLKGLIKLPSVTIDNLVFRLHYKFTVLILAVFSLVVTYKQFFGDNIACTQLQTNNAPQNLVELYCWTEHTFSYRDAFEKDHESVIYPGVSTERKDSVVVEHKYYQWVCFMLALQAVLFYVPRYLWKDLEGGRVKNLVLGLNLPIIESEESKDKKRDLLVGYLKNHRRCHGVYTSSYVFCEFLNFVNVACQMYILDTFFDGQFLTFGIRVIRFSLQIEKTDPMLMLFPRMVICRFYHYGPTGNVAQLDYYCIIPLNIINEKVFIFIWFWFVFLFMVTFLGLIYRLLMFTIPAMRILALKTRCTLSNCSDVEAVTRGSSSIGDWFILYQLAKNVESEYMADVLRVYAEQCIENRVTFHWSTEPCPMGSYYLEESEV